MSKPSLSIIVAAAENNAIGKDNQLLWHLPNDLKFFKRTTSGHPVIMGRKTMDSLNNKPLPNRRNIVVTRQQDYRIEGADTVHSLEEAFAQYADGKQQEVFILGGAEIYKQALPDVDKIYLTRVHAQFEADSFFPPLPETDWELVQQEKHTADERHAYPYTFQVFHRKRG